MDEVNTKDAWDKKKIFLAVFLIILLFVGGYFFKTRILGIHFSSQSKSVKAASTEINIGASLGQNIQQAVKEKIDGLKQEVSNLNLVEVASSSPQVQKIINDIKSLQQYPNDQIKEVCKKVCGL